MAGIIFPRDFNKELPYAVRGEGIYLYDETGKRYIDGCSGALISSIGHCVPEVAEGIYKQMTTLNFAHPSAWRNYPAEKAAAALAEITPADLDYIFFVSGGSEAVESAIKLSRQFFIERKGTDTMKHLVIGRWNSYHGATLGAMSVGGNIPRRRMFAPQLKDNPKICSHYCYRCPYHMTYPDCGVLCARELEYCIQRVGPENVAGFIAEPLVGSTAGALVPPDEYWPMVREICDRYDVLLLADEVMTGIGRTGKYFALDHWTKRDANRSFSTASIVDDPQLATTNVLEIAISHGGSDFDDVFVKQQDIALEAGVLYRICLRARAEDFRQMRTTLRAANGTAYWSAVQDLTPQAQTFTYLFESAADNEQVVLYLGLGGSKADVWLDDISITEAWDCARLLENGLTRSTDMGGPLGVPDCRIDVHDLRAFADQWLVVDTMHTDSHDALIAWPDFVDLAKDWLECYDPQDVSCVP